MGSVSNFATTKQPKKIDFYLTSYSLYEIEISLTNNEFFDKFCHKLYERFKLISETRNYELFEGLCFFLDQTQHRLLQDHGVCLLR